jgi:hypothetical protein
MKSPVRTKQKPRARDPHWDLPLEVKRALKSWALSKGPSVGPRVRLLAVQIPDHFSGRDGAVILAGKEKDHEDPFSG